MTKLVLAGAFLAVAAGGCQKQEKQAPARPSKTVVDAMGEYCRIGNIPREEWKDAQKAWGWHWAADKEMGPLWTRVAKKDPAAIALVLAAADEAAGVGKCPILDVIR
ncbi:MAG: hypothetical protein SFX73_03510 [Kofleriaceae bacterium]|nr:hypothetical protein [Kofleriaceae bacterium]